MTDTTAAIAALKTDIKVCMFDQYGTVVDMQKGLTEVATPYLQGKGWTGRPDAFVTWWRRTHFENSMIDALLHTTHTSYREIGERAVDYTLERAGIAHTQAEVEALVEAIVRLQPFPDVPQALARLRSRYKLVVLSNGDPDMLEAAKAWLAKGAQPTDRVARFLEAAGAAPRTARANPKKGEPGKAAKDRAQKKAARAAEAAAEAAA